MAVPLRRLSAPCFIHKLFYSKIFLVRGQTANRGQASSTNSDCNSFTWRTHTCGELRSSHVGEKVVLCGWVQFKRMTKFLTLRDGYGITQVVFSENHPKEKEFSNLVSGLTLESVIKVVGTVANRPEGQENKMMETGSVEVLVENIEVFGRCLSKLPFIPREFSKVKDSLRLQYRYLDFRNNVLQHNLRMKSDVVMKIREYLCKLHGFVDIETPTLFKRTPGGAQEFVVPTRQQGLYYSLTQSPQQFKQLLMIGSLDRYFQIARCYRDETSTPERQPEFTQVDIEMSFVTSEGIMSLIEGMLSYCWPDHLLSIDTPFPKMSYFDAMRYYGSDKPDTRFQMKLMDMPDCLTDSLKQFFTVPSGCTDFIMRTVVAPNLGPLLTNSFQERLKEDVKSRFSILNLSFVKVGINLSWTTSLTKFLTATAIEKTNQSLQLKTDDVLIICAGNQNTVNACLGKLRLDVASFLENSGINVGRSPDDQNFIWIVDFPLFQLTDEGVYEATHHPFTAPHADDEHLLHSNGGDISKIRGQHYDLVLNGAEIAGGSIRIHDAELQKYILEDILKEDSSTLSHLIEALSSGCPPHGGIAIGFDRLMAIICRATSIRDVIAFPKTIGGRDLMSGAPSPISEAEKILYHQGK